MFRQLIEAVLANLQIANDPVRYARSIGVKIGEDCRLLNIRSGTFGSEPYLISLGNHVTVTSGVRFVTHDGGVWVFRQDHPDIDVFGLITIKDNVFIGMDSIILPGVTVGTNSIIGAGAIVTKSIPAESVAVGVPARVIKTIDEYRESISNRTFYIRSLPPEKRRAILEKHFFGESRKQEVKQNECR